MYSPFLIAIVAIVGSFTYSIVRSLANARVRELEVRERIAMIERGLVPPPEKDPQGFDRAMNRYDRLRDQDDDSDWYPGRRTPGRYRSAGITPMGVGFGLMLMIGSGWRARVGHRSRWTPAVIGLAFSSTVGSVATTRRPVRPSHYRRRVRAAGPPRAP